MINTDRALLLCLLGGYTVKLLALGSNLSDALVVLVLAGAHFLYNSQIQNKEIKELANKIEELEKKNVEQTKLNEDLKSSISSVKITQGLRSAK